jgi:hypothetical protein
MARHLYFDHVPKTGGTSFHQVLIAWFGDAQVSPPIAGQRFTDVLHQYGHLAAISGHIHYGIGDKLDPTRLNVTIVRDPIDRAVSQYFFNKETVANQVRGEQGTLELSLEAFFAQNEGSRLTEYSNIYARHFAALSPEYHSSVDRLDESRLLELAKSSLSSFDVVGVSTHLEDFCAITAMALGIARHVSPLRTRVTQGRPALGDISNDALTRLRELNVVDIELADFAKSLFRRKRTQTLIHSISISANGAGSSTESAVANALTEDVMASRQTGSREIEILDIAVTGSLGAGADLLTGEELSVAITLLAHVTEDDLTVGIHISEPSGARVFGTNSRLLGVAIAIKSPGQLVVTYSMKCELGRGEYFVGATLHTGKDHLDKCYHWTNRSSGFKVLGALGVYFEGKTRLHPSICVSSGENSPALYASSDDASVFPSSVMLQSPPLTDFQAAFAVAHFDYEPKSGEIFNLDCFVTNRGEQAWPVAGTRPVSVCYHWLNVDRTIAVFDGIRTRLNSEIASGQQLNVLAQIQAPYKAGEFILQLTAVQDGVGWFDEKGCRPFEVAFSVSN